MLYSVRNECKGIISHCMYVCVQNTLCIGNDYALQLIKKVLVQIVLNTDGHVSGWQFSKNARSTNVAATTIAAAAVVVVVTVCWKM